MASGLRSLLHVSKNKHYVTVTSFWGMIIDLQRAAMTELNKLKKALILKPLISLLGCGSQPLNTKGHCSFLSSRDIVYTKIQSEQSVCCIYRWFCILKKNTGSQLVRLVRFASGVDFWKAVYIDRTVTKEHSGFHKRI